jgi:hypothetical protein
MIPLKFPDSIGDSLSAITFDYNAVDSRTYYLNLSSSNLFQPLKAFIDDKFLDFTSLISITMHNSSKWVDLRTDISTNSAAWVKPVVYIYPTLLKDPVNLTTFYQVTASFVQRYPMFLGENPEYVENQKAYVYYYSYDIVNYVNDKYIKNSNMAYCECPPSFNLVIRCSDTSGGSVNCDNGSFSCSSCANSNYGQSQWVPCYYENDLNYINRYMQIFIDAYFDDRYEKSLKGAIFQVKNCKWEFVRYMI